MAQVGFGKFSPIQNCAREVGDALTMWILGGSGMIVVFYAPLQKFDKFWFSHASTLEQTGQFCFTTCMLAPQLILQFLSMPLDQIDQQRRYGRSPAEFLGPLEGAAVKEF